MTGHCWSLSRWCGRRPPAASFSPRGSTFIRRQPANPSVCATLTWTTSAYSCECKVTPLRRKREYYTTIFQRAPERLSRRTASRQLLPQNNQTRKVQSSSYRVAFELSPRPQDTRRPISVFRREPPQGSVGNLEACLRAGNQRRRTLDASHYILRRR